MQFFGRPKSSIATQSKKNTLFNYFQDSDFHKH